MLWPTKRFNTRAKLRKTKCVNQFVFNQPREIGWGSYCWSMSNLQVFQDFYLLSIQLFLVLNFRSLPSLSSLSWSPLQYYVEESFFFLSGRLSVCWEIRLESIRHVSNCFQASLFVKRLSWDRQLGSVLSETSLADMTRIKQPGFKETLKPISPILWQNDNVGSLKNAKNALRTLDQVTSGSQKLKAPFFSKHRDNGLLIPYGRS